MMKTTVYSSMTVLVLLSELLYPDRKIVHRQLSKSKAF
jgi:hypothetical protein